MRKRDPNHEASLNKLKSDLAQLKELLTIDDYQNPNFIASEVLSSLVRLRFGSESDLLGAITKVLHKRVIKGIQSHINKSETLRSLIAENRTSVGYIASYFWEKFFEDQQDVSNAEVRFGVYLKNRIVDYTRYLLTDKNTAESADALSEFDDEGNSSNLIDALEDDLDDLPEEVANRNQEKSILAVALMKLPKIERNIFNFRVEFEYDWNKVAQLSGCSIPTAKKLYKASLVKLQGALK